MEYGFDIVNSTYHSEIRPVELFKVVEKTLSRTILCSKPLRSFRFFGGAK